MTDTERTTNEVLARHGLQQPLDRLLYSLEHEREHHQSCMCDECNEAHKVGPIQPYDDADGNRRNGRVRYVHATVLRPKPNVSHITNEDMKSLRKGLTIGVAGGLILYGLAWLFWEYAPRILAYMVRWTQ